MTRTALALLMTLGLATPALAGPTTFPSALPPVSNPGECYAQIRVPAQYSQGTQTVITKDAHTEISVTEPQLQSRTEQVLTKEASVRYEVRQPRYSTVSEQIVTRPAHDRLSVAPPQFSTVTETFQTSAPHLVWKRGNPGQLRAQGYVIHSTADGRLRDQSGYTGGSYGTTQSGGDSCGAGCEIWCLVEEPGQSVKIRRRVMSAPSRVVRTPVPAQTRTLTKQVVADPGGVREIPVPAEYASVTVQDLVRPAEAYEVNVPAEYGRAATKELVSPERYEWRRVLCAPGTQGRSAPVSQGYQHRYTSPQTHSQTTYSQTTYSAPSHARTGYYGTEKYPAYRR